MGNHTVVIGYKRGWVWVFGTLMHAARYMQLLGKLGTVLGPDPRD